MKKSIISLVICFIFVGAGGSFAEDPLQTWPPQGSISNVAEPSQIQRNTLEIGVEMSQIKYEEPGVMEEEGYMYGITASHNYHNKEFVLKTEGKFSYGQVDYKNSGTIDDIDDFMFEFRLLGGYDFPILKASVFTPYIGIGYRYLNDDTSGRVSSTGASGYERESNYLYSPIGIETLTNLGNEWYIGLKLEYDFFWAGMQISHLENVGCNRLDNDQDDGYGWRGSIKVQKKGERVAFLLKPFIRYWNIDKSQVSTITCGGSIYGFGWEPDNESTEIGVNFSVIF
jgi:hypothetical protein